jgi:hypothetical protein
MIAQSSLCDSSVARPPAGKEIENVARLPSSHCYSKVGYGREARHLGVSVCCVVSISTLNDW